MAITNSQWFSGLRARCSWRIVATRRAVRINSWAPNVYPPVNKHNLSTGESGENGAHEAEVGPN
jgi:hypothetical protein